MSQPNPNSIQLVPLPAEINPPDLVENTFNKAPVVDKATLDTVSKQRMEDYLVDRFNPDDGPNYRTIYIPTGRTTPRITRIPNGYKDVTRYRRTGEWLVSPKLAAAVIAGSLALANAAPASEAVENIVHDTSHGIYRLFHPVKSTTETIVGPGKTIIIKMDAAADSKVGSVDVDRDTLDAFAAQVGDAVGQGATVSVTETSRTSDDWASKGDSSISTTDAENQALGIERQNAADTILQELGIKTAGSITVVKATAEKLTQPDLKASLLAEAKANGYPSIIKVIDAVDAGKEVKPSLALGIRDQFTGKGNRGISLEARVEMPGQAITHNNIIPGKDNPPKHEPVNWRLLFIPLIPIPRLRRSLEVREKTKLKVIPSTPVYRPEIVREDIEHAWVRIRPEAKQDDGTLLHAPWAYTRKYEDLLRDGRIADVLRGDYINQDGENKSIRVLFIDKSPSDQKVEAFEKLLKSFASMGKDDVANNITNISVFPSENAGTSHANPKLIGLGIDKQSDTNILGTCTPIMELVELHMPSTWDEDELTALFQDFDGPGWTAAHEVAGHGTDITEGSRLLQPVHTSGIPNAHIIRGETWAEHMSPMQKLLKNIPRFNFMHSKPDLFDITYRVADSEGQIKTVSARVEETDPRFGHAATAAIVGRKPTRYAGENVLEHYAETAAAVTTGIPIPFTEARVKIVTSINDDGTAAVQALGYQPDLRGQKQYTDTVGGIEGALPIAFENPRTVNFTFTKPDNDRLLRYHLIRARSSEILPPERMIAILARVLGRSAK